MAFVMRNKYVAGHLPDGGDLLGDETCSGFGAGGGVGGLASSVAAADDNDVVEGGETGGVGV